MYKNLRNAAGGPAHAHVPELGEALRRGAVSRREFLRTACLLGLSAGTAYALAGRITGEAVVPRARAQTPKTGGVLRMGMRVREIGDPATIDSVTQSNQVRTFLEYLTRTGADNVTRPYLAESWEASDDLKTWTFHLRRDVTWSNGDAFNAEDVIFNITRWLDPAVGSSNIGLFSGLVEEVDSGKKDDSGKAVMVKRMIAGSVEKVDEHSVRLHLSKPDLAIPESLFHFSAPIAHRRFAEEGGDLRANPVGTGPFMLESLTPGERMTVQRRTGYWGGDVPLDGVDFIDLGEDPSAMLNALQSGQIDLAYEFSIDQVAALEGMGGITIFEQVTAQTAVARMQSDKAPFTDKKVRQALIACLDNAKILEIAYRGRGAVGENHHVAPIHPEYFALPHLQQDYARAKALLAEAGFPDGVKVEIAVTNATGTWEGSAVEAMKAQCAPAGIDIAINVMPAAMFWDIWLDAPFCMTPWTHRPLGVMVLNLAYRSGVPWNEAHYSNPAFDAALTEASGILDAEQRRAKMQEVERILQDDAVIAQPLWRPVITAGLDKVQGFAMHPTQYYDLAKVWLA
jgi:peptide/nickel transport system substrate-binding protein